MAVTYEILDDSFDLDKDGVSVAPIGAKFRRLRLSIAGVNTTPEAIMPVFEGSDYIGMAVTAKNTGGQALSAFDIYYGMAEDDVGVILDDSRDHWEKETGFTNLAAGATRYAIMTHPMPAKFTLKAKTSTGTTTMEVIVTLCLR